MKYKNWLKKTDNPREYNIFKRYAYLRCAICLPNKGENVKRRNKKPRYWGDDAV